MLGIRHARAAFAAAILLTALPLALCQVTEGTEGDGWVEIGPDQNDEPGRVTLLQSFNAGYICLSIVLSILGAACSLELLLRRTSNRGAWNIALLVGAGTSFGAISCFALHFIGNNSLTLLRPASASEPARYLTLAYDPGFTILSLVVSVLSMIVAFTVMGLDLDALFHKRRRPRSNSTSESEASFDSHEEKTQKTGSRTLATPANAAIGWVRRGLSSRITSDAPAADKVPMQEVKLTGLTKTSLAQLELETKRAETTVVTSSDSGGHTPGATALGLETFTFGSSAPGARPPISLQGPMDIGPSDHDVEDDDERDIDRARLHASLRRSFASSATGNTSGDLAAQNAEAGPSRLTYNLPSVLPPPSAEYTNPGGLKIDLVGQSTPFPLCSFNQSAALEHEPLRTSSASPTRQMRSATSRSNHSLDAAYSSTPSRGRQPAASTPVTPTSGRSTRRISHPTALPAMLHAPLAIRDQMTFEEFENSALGGGRLAFIRGSESSQGSSNGAPQRRHSAASTLERPASERSRRPSAFTNNSGLQGDGWETDDGGYASGGRLRAPEAQPFSADAGHQPSEKPRVARPRDRHDLRLQQSELRAAAYRDEEEALAHLTSLQRSRATSVDPASTTSNGRCKPLSWAARHLGYGQSTKSEMTKVVVAGVICGFGVAGMHYIGQRSITSVQHIRYNPGIVVASVVIACVAITAGLWIMFIVLRPKLKHSYIKRALVACFLGSATALMHYVAMLGSSYAVDVGVMIPTSARQRRAKRVITALVASLAAAACLITVASAAFAQRQLRINRRKRRGLVVTAAIFDEAGHMLVSPEGSMPVQNIALDIINVRSSLFQRSFGSRPGSFSGESINSSVLTAEFDLTPQHQAFIAALRRTWAWRRGGDEAPPPPRVLALHNAPSQTSIVSEDAIATVDSAWSAGYKAAAVGPEPPVSQSVQRFLERFAHATSRLAEEVTGSAELIGRLGVLHDRILTTGFLTFGSGGKEAGPSDTASSGQMLFLVNRVTAEHKSQLLRRGFMFHAPQAVAGVMSSALAVPPADMTTFLESVQTFSNVLTSPQIQRGRIYVSALVTQALPHGLRVAVGRVDRNILPTRELGTIASALDPVIGSVAGHASFPAIAQDVGHLGDLVSGLAGASLLSLVRLDLAGQAADDPTTRFKTLLARTIFPLFDQTPPAVTRLILQHLVLAPVLVPLFPPSHRASRVPSYSIVFRAVLEPIVDVADLGPALSFESFKLFRAQNESFMADFIRRDGLKIHRDLANEPSADGHSPFGGLQHHARRLSKVHFTGLSPQLAGQTTPTGSSEAGGSGFHLHPDLFAASFGSGGAGMGQPTACGRRPSIISQGPDSDPPSPPPSLARPVLNRLRSGSQQVAASPVAGSLASQRPSVARTRSVETFSARPSVAAFDPQWMLGLLREERD